MLDQKQREKCLQEVKLLQTFDHPNIVKYLDSFISNNELYIAIEWADRGDLKRLLRKISQENDKLEELNILGYTKQLASALSHMHEKRIIHRDLKPANILIFSDGTLKLGDLGLGRYMSDHTFKAFSKVGTPLYMSPEVIRNEGYDFKSDIWSLGCVCYELITLKSPFRTDEKISLFELFNKINKGDYPKLNDSRISNELKDVIERMLKVDPEKRIPLEDVVKQIEFFFTQVEERPRIDPFIIMEDILEKLKLIDFEENFCKKYNKDPITKFSFSCSIYGKPNTGGILSGNALNSNNNVQFALFYELCNWLFGLIKQSIDLNRLSDTEVKFKRYDKRKSIDTHIGELMADLKIIGVKIPDSSKISNGYGEAVCLIITQLLDRYLINQNYTFRNISYNDVEMRKRNSNKENNLRASQVKSRGKLKDNSFCNDDTSSKKINLSQLVQLDVSSNTLMEEKDKLNKDIAIVKQEEELNENQNDRILNYKNKDNEDENHTILSKPDRNNINSAFSNLTQGILI